jgi:hypothetical protein
MQNNLNEIPQILLLAVSGMFGSIFHTIRKPEKSVRAWLVRFVSGMIAAVFMGLLVTEKLGGGTAAAMAVGFSFGAFTEQLVAIAMEKIGGKK